MKPPQQQPQQPYAGTASLGIATAGSGDMFSGLAVPTGSEMLTQVGCNAQFSGALRGGPLLFAELLTGSRRETVSNLTRTSVFLW